MVVVTVLVSASIVVFVVVSVFRASNTPSVSCSALASVAADAAFVAAALFFAVLFAAPASLPKLADDEPPILNTLRRTMMGKNKSAMKIFW